MYLSEKLQQRSFVEWNYLVRGLVEVWEMARLLGFEQHLEEALRADSEAVLAEKLAAEVRQATTTKNGARAADLGRNLRELLVRGVAVNLSLAHHRIPGAAHTCRGRALSYRPGGPGEYA